MKISAFRVKLLSVITVFISLMVWFVSMFFIPDIKESSPLLVDLFDVRFQIFTSADRTADSIALDLQIKELEERRLTEIEKQEELEKETKRPIAEKKRAEQEERELRQRENQTVSASTYSGNDGSELENEKTYRYQKSVAKKIENSKEYKAVQGKFKWDGAVLNKSNGVVIGPHGRETYYNLPMGGVISIMRGLGNHDKYWIRSDGCKMLGNYIMVAAKVDSKHKRGRIIKCSRGFAIVCDTGSFLSRYPNGVDIAVTW